MAQVNGYYTMDKICELTGEEDVGDIPLSTMLRSIGDNDPFMTQNILTFLPKDYDYSAFNAVMDLPLDHDVHQKFLSDSLTHVQTEGYHENVNDMRLNDGELAEAYFLAKLVMKIGIPNTASTLAGREDYDKNTDFKSKKIMQLKWAAAKGPQPVDFDEDVAFAIMQAAHYMLFHYCKHKCSILDVGHNLRVNFKNDLNYILSSAWHGINGWRV